MVAVAVVVSFVAAQDELFDAVRAWDTEVDGLVGVNEAVRLRLDLPDLPRYYNVWINEVGFLPKSLGGGVAFVELAGSEFASSIGISYMNGSGTIIAEQIALSFVLPVNDEVGFIRFNTTAAFFRDSSPADIKAVGISFQLPRSPPTPFQAVKWVPQPITYQPRFSPSSVEALDITLPRFAPLEREPFGSGLALVGRGATLSDFRGYNQIIYKEVDPPGKGLNPGQKIFLRCYQSQVATAALRREPTCFALKSGSSTAGEVCIDIDEEAVTETQCFTATFKYANGFTGQSASFGAFKNCGVPEDKVQATTPAGTPPSTEQTLSVCFDQVPYTLREWSEFLPRSCQSPRCKANVRCCKLRRCLYMSANAVDSSGNTVEVSAVGARCRGRTGRCIVNTKCTSTPTPVPKPATVWVNEIGFKPAANASDTSTIVNYFEVAGYGWGGILLPYFFDGKGELIDLNNFIFGFQQPPNGTVGVVGRAGLSLDAKALLFTQRTVVGSFEVEELIQFVTWMEDFPGAAPVTSGAIDPAILNVLAKNPNAKAKYIVPDGSVPLNQPPFGTGLFKTGSGSNLDDFPGFTQEPYTNLDREDRSFVATLNPGQTITVP